MNKNFATHAATLRTEYLQKTETLFISNKAAWFVDFTRNFHEICVEIRKLQDRAALTAIAYLEYTMLYTNIMDRHYVAELFVYNDKGYLDKNQRIIGEYDISFLFIYFERMWDKLLSERKRYVGKVTSREITAFMVETLPFFGSYLANIARFSIVDCIDKSPFVNINKNDVFRVNVGDYLAYTENIYIEKKNKDARILAKWFEERYVNVYTFNDYSGLDFSGLLLTFTDFRYSQFRNSCLQNASLEGSALIGANFHMGRMDNCCLDNCSINEANFSHAMLRGASFKYARGRASQIGEQGWKQVGFSPVNFRNADLTGVNFTGANLVGADFTGAKLDNVVFTDAVMDGAIFDSNGGNIKLS